MAFSYSDKNFTIVGNLCFVHACITKTGYGFCNIPPAIVSRMMIDNFRCVFMANKADGTESANSSCFVHNGMIEYSNPKETAYLNFFFPIDSNK